MAYIKQAGTDDVGNDFPWFWQTDITCPRCTAVFRLTHEETLPGVVGPIGATNSIWLGWRQVVESATPQSAALDLANLHVDPAQVYGACPYCGYNPIVVKGPRYGLAKVTLNTDPLSGALQNRYAGGDRQVCFLLDGFDVMRGLFLLASGSPDLADSAGNYGYAIVRQSSGVIDATVVYALATPATRITVAEAQLRDAPLCAILVRAGLTLV